MDAKHLRRASHPGLQWRVTANRGAQKQTQARPCWLDRVDLDLWNWEGCGSKAELGQLLPWKEGKRQFGVPMSVVLEHRQYKTSNGREDGLG